MISQIVLSRLFQIVSVSALQIIMSAQDQGEALESVQVGAHEQAQVLQGLVGQVLGVVDRDDGVDSSFGQMGALTLDGVGQASPIVAGKEAEARRHS